MSCFIEESSALCAKSELELFSVPPTQTSFESNTIVKHYPLTSLDLGGPIEFKITVGDAYIDPSYSVLVTTCRILDNRGNELIPKADDANLDIYQVCPINYFHATKFKNIEIFLNGTLVSANDNLYSYRSYIDTLFCYGKNALESNLQLGMFYADENNFDEHNDFALSSNGGAKKRYELSKNSKQFKTIGLIHADLFTQPKLLPPNTELRVRLHRHDSAFSLMSKLATHEYNIIFDSAYLLMRHARVAP
jgi:hypothetical protein